MENGFFCNKCGMVKSNCTCNNENNRLTRASEIPLSRINEIKKQHPHIKPEVVENFPFTEPREGQLEIIDNIKNAIDEGYPYILLEAGTGTGKSAIATTLAGIYQPAYILTMTKQLQSQYGIQFGYPLVKGRGNFSCKDDLEFSCDIGTCQTTPPAD